MYVINLILDIPLRNGYSYLHSEVLPRGTAVSIELRGRTQIGFVASSVPATQFSAYPLDKLKPILAVGDSNLIIPEHIWQLCEFAANYYHHPLGNTLFCAIPVLLRKSTEINYIAVDNTYYQATDSEIQPRGTKRQQLLEILRQQALSLPQIRAFIGANSTNLIDEWLTAGLVQITEQPPASYAHQPLLLNPEQAQVVNTLSAELGKFHAALLYGITGSGKTEVFLHLIAQVLANNQQIMVLVPEINLTPQLAKRFEQRFPYSKISLINSEISDKQRLNAWLSAKSGQTNIILGTRLSVFTPCANLGLIIVDEEHDDSFKQNDSLRYHARDLAVWRAKQLQIPIILASATPSLETLYNYKAGKYSLYKLTTRAVQNALLPQIGLLNLQHYPANFAGINQIALEKLAACLERKELALVFINRRGYAPVITCYDCGWVSTCLRCSTNMVYHHDKHQLKCHHCGYQTQVPPACPVCHNQYLHTIGHGTQKLEEFLTEQFPKSKIKRVDRDTTSTKKAWQQIYNEINQQEIDILVGTQMLAKGHDFANLTLVIGLNLDNALFSYDFRASEDMFNVLTQVAGRAGRADKAGLVLLQTNYPDHPVYQFLKNHDFNGFINHTFQERKAHNLPPFAFYALIKISSTSESTLKHTMQELSTQSKQIPHPEVTLYSCVPAVMYKLHNRYRAQMLISSNNRNALHHYLNTLESQLKPNNYVTIAVDVDPLEV